MTKKIERKDKATGEVTEGVAVFGYVAGGGRIENPLRFATELPGEGLAEKWFT